MAQSVSELRNVLQGDDMGSKIEAADLEQGKVVLAVASFISGAVDAVAASGTIDSFNGECSSLFHVCNYDCLDELTQKLVIVYRQSSKSRVSDVFFDTVDRT